MHACISHDLRCIFFFLRAGQGSCGGGSARQGRRRVWWPEPGMCAWVFWVGAWVMCGGLCFLLVVGDLSWWEISCGLGLGAGGWGVRGGMVVVGFWGILVRIGKVGAVNLLLHLGAKMGMWIPNPPGSLLL